MVRDDDKYKILKEFYSTGAEDKRLKEDKAHQVEFLIMLKRDIKYPHLN